VVRLDRPDLVLDNGMDIVRHHRIRNAPARYDLGVDSFGGLCFERVRWVLFLKFCAGGGVYKGSVVTRDCMSILQKRGDSARAGVLAHICQEDEGH
jgi:hypothetical protein